LARAKGTVEGHEDQAMRDQRADRGNQQDGNAQNQSGAQTSESRIQDKVMGTPRHGLDMRATSPWNRPAEWVDLSRRGWHERATYLVARVQ
jgi:hypothetical protein